MNLIQGGSGNPNRDYQNMRDRKAPALLLVAAFILAAVFGALLDWSMFFPCVRSLIFPGGIVVLQKGQWTVEMGNSLFCCYLPRVC